MTATTQRTSTPSATWSAASRLCTWATARACRYGVRAPALRQTAVAASRDTQCYSCQAPLTCPPLYALQPPVLRRCRQLHAAVQRHRAEQEQRARRTAAGTISKVAHAAASFVGSVASSVFSDCVVSTVSSPPQPSALELLQEAGVPVQVEDVGQRTDSGKTGWLFWVTVACMHLSFCCTGPALDRSSCAGLRFGGLWSACGA